MAFFFFWPCFVWLYCREGDGFLTGGPREEDRIRSVTPFSQVLVRIVQTGVHRMCGAGEDADVRALQSDRSTYTLTALNSRARVAPADSRAARPCPSCAGLGGVFLGGGAERAATRTRLRAERPCAAWGTSLHAVVMRGVWVSVPSLVTPGRSAPPPPAQVRLHPSAARPHRAVFPEGAPE